MAMPRTVRAAARSFRPGNIYKQGTDLVGISQGSNKVYTEVLAE